MRLFIDCEWNEYKGDLISMALVSEDGREWYEVFYCHDPKDWIKANVMPKLGKKPITFSEGHASLRNFLVQFNKCTIIADWPEDIAHFCNFLIVGPGLRIDTPRLTFEIHRVDSVSDNPHNALADAKGLKKQICCV